MDQVAELAADHRALEVAGTRLSGYESVYYDTPALTCFYDHVASRAPRFKVRSRLYRESDHCALEVKVKQTDGETVKLSSFGSFVVRSKGERVGRNPKTGQEVPIAPRRVMVFKPSNILKAKINGQSVEGMRD